LVKSQNRKLGGRSWEYALSAGVEPGMEGRGKKQKWFGGVRDQDSEVGHVQPRSMCRVSAASVKRRRKSCDKKDGSYCERELPGAGTNGGATKPRRPGTLTLRFTDKALRAISAMNGGLGRKTSELSSKLVEIPAEPTLKLSSHKKWETLGTGRNGQQILRHVTRGKT